MKCLRFTGRFFSSLLFFSLGMKREDLERAQVLPGRERGKRRQGSPCTAQLSSCPLVIPAALAAVWCLFTLRFSAHAAQFQESVCQPPCFCGLVECTPQAVVASPCRGPLWSAPGAGQSSAISAAAAQAVLNLLLPAVPAVPVLECRVGSTCSFPHFLTAPKSSPSLFFCDA